MIALGRRFNVMIDSLNRFLHYLDLGVEEGLSGGTIKAYRMDIEKGFSAFLYNSVKYEAKEVTKDDIRSYLDYTAVSMGTPA
jgi:site-specific recombinase XerD